MFKIKRIEKRVNTRKIMYSALAFIVVGITTMTLAYATLSTTLKITGSAEFQDASWNLLLEEYPMDDLPEIPPNATVNGNVLSYGNAQLITKPTIVGTQLNNYKVSLGKLGDMIMLEYKLTNLGNIPAKAVSGIWNEFEVTSESNDESDIELVYENFLYIYELYEIIYNEEGEMVDSIRIGPDDILCPGAVFVVQIVHGYNGAAPRVPYGKTTISNMGVEIKFEAADQNLCDGKNPVTPNDENDLE